MEIENSLFICTSDVNDQKFVSISSEYKNVQKAEIPDSDLSHILKEQFKIERLENGNPKMFRASQEVIDFLDNKLRTLIAETNNPEGTCSQLLVEIFRSLRNCSSNASTQNYIAIETKIPATVKSLFRITGISYSTLKIVLQFLINLTSSNEKVTKRIHVEFYDDIQVFLQQHLCVYESSALLYNMSLFVLVNDPRTLEITLDLYSSEHHNEFLCFFVENGVASDEFWSQYSALGSEYRLKLLDAVKDMQIQDRLNNLSDFGLELFVTKFLECGEVMFQMNRKNALEAREISSVLEILSALSSKDGYLKKLQLRKDILINAGALLINVHRLGKLSENCFSPVQKLSENGIENRELSQQPAFGFKADLVRLVGNVCWKNTEMQNLARTADIIPIILDCCNIDAKNPFIMQWCILAVRNLCDNNVENQRIIASLHREGAVNNEVLEEMGITLHSDGWNELKIVSLETLRR